MGVSQFTILSIILALCVAPVYAAESASSDEVSVPAMPFGPSAQFNAMNTQAMGNMLSACLLMPATGALATGMTSGAAAGLGALGGGACAVGDIKVPSETLSCDSFKKGDKFDADKFAKKKKEIDDSLGALSCQQSKLAGVSNQLNCLNTQVSAMQNQITSLQASFTQNIQTFEQDVQKLKSVEEDREAQHRDVQSHLLGDERSGAKGLLKIRDEARGIVDAMEREIQAIAIQQKAVEEQNKVLEEDTQRKTMAQANVCFATKKSSGLKCSPNGPAVSAREFSLCIYEQQQTVGSGGVVERSNLRSKTAAAKRGELENVLNGILGESPTDTKASKSMDEAAQKADSGIDVLNFAEFEAKYGTTLAGYNSSTFNVHNFILKQMKNCYVAAQKTVARQKTLAGSEYTQNQQKIKEMERKTANEANDLLTKYGNQYSAIMSGLTGVHFPVNTSACRSSGNATVNRISGERAAPSIQMDCLQKLKTNVRGAWDGTLPQSTVQFMVKGNDPKTTISFQCGGLDGCITKLQSLSKNLDKEKQRVRTFRKDYTMKANQQVQAATKRIADGMSTQNRALGDQLNSINTLLASLGVRSQIRVGRTKGEALQFGEEPDGGQGLVKPPTNIMGLISGSMDPGLIDLQDGTFTESLSAIQEKSQDFDEKKQTLAEAKEAMEGSLLAKCMEDESEKLNKYLADQVPTLENCLWNSTVCGNAANKEPLEALLQSLQGAASAGDFPRASIQGVLDAGVKCNSDGDGSVKKLAADKKDASDQADFAGKCIVQLQMYSAKDTEAKTAESYVDQGVGDQATLTQKARTARSAADSFWNSNVVNACKDLKEWFSFSQQKDAALSLVTNYKDEQKQKADKIKEDNPLLSAKSGQTAFSCSGVYTGIKGRVEKFAQTRDAVGSAGATSAE